MKKMLFAAALVATLTLTAAAAEHSKLAKSQRTGGGNPDATVKMAPEGNAPALCNPCLFYGGDINVNDPNADGFTDENTLLISSSSTYGALNIASGHDALVNAILFNILASAAFDPSTASYDIRTGVSEGNGGTEVTSGSGSIKIQATGNVPFGFTEYTIGVAVNPPITLTGGQTYWFNVTPNCTDGAIDGSCSVGRFFVSNTTQGTNNVRGTLQPLNQMFLNSVGFGLTWNNWCDFNIFGLNPAQCGALSYGLVGTGH